MNPMAIPGNRKLSGKHFPRTYRIKNGRNRLYSFAERIWQEVVAHVLKVYADNDVQENTFSFTQRTKQTLTQHRI